jgi:hypothetical protein
MGKRELVVVWSTPRRLTTDEEVLMAALAFAKGADLELRLPDGEGRRATALDRDEFVNDAARAIKDRAAFANEFMPTALRLIRAGGLSQSFTVTPSGLRRGFGRTFKSVRHLLDYALAIIADGENAPGRYFCRCKLPSCRVFYIAKKNPIGGGYNLTYCKREHRTEHHDSSARRLGRA